MTHEFNVKPSRRSGSILGAVIVVFLGCLGAGVVTGAAGGDPVYVMGVFLGGAVGIAILLWLATTGPVARLGDAVNWLLVRHRQDDQVYLPRARQAQPQRFGTNVPPSADEVRELKEGGNTWVPSPTRSSRTPPRSDQR